MNEEDFLRVIRAEPDSETHWRVYADWLEEQGSPRAEYVRLLVQRKAPAAEVSRIDARLQSLRKEVGHGWIVSITFGPGPLTRSGEYRLTDGRPVQLYNLRQSLTYAGLLEGLPTDRMNQRTIDHLLEEGRSRGAEPYLVPPVITPIAWRQDRPYPFGTPEQLPDVTCVGMFRSLSPARDETMDASSLTIIWFQEEYAMPIAPGVLEHILHIDWNNLANDWQW